MIGSEEIESEGPIKLVGVFIDKKTMVQQVYVKFLKESKYTIYSIKRLGNLISKIKISS